VRAPAAVLAILVSAAVPSAAQDSLGTIATKAICFRAKPKPACSAFLVTNFGPYVGVAGRDYRFQARLRLVADWGVMFNVSTREAIGASWFASLDDDEFMVGPVARYRRWTSPRASIEFAVGTPLYAYSNWNRGPLLGSILGLVRWSPASWFSVTARPELHLRRVYVGPSYNDFEIQPRGRFSIGMEGGQVPGIVLLVVGVGLYSLYPADQPVQY